MDHVILLNQVRSEKNLAIAFHYALNDRKKNDSYFDHLEIDYVTQNKNKILTEILDELKSPSSFLGRPAYSYYLPKNNLCYRRMIYLPFKDLVIRYAFVIVLANYLDASLSPGCFANRRASGKQANNFFLENYYHVSLAKFKAWQKQCAENNKYQVLIRTDISSFYDSISHQYLIKTIAQQLAIEPDTEFIQLFQKLLTPKIISYSHKNKKVQPPQILCQGLIIGNNVEGFLANLYLRDVDEAMQEAGIEFGRYNDDMRIFAENPQKAKLYLLILQEYLLSKGLNLNASKTIIAQNKKEIELLRTKTYEDISAWFPDADIDDAEVEEVLQNELKKHIDKEYTFEEVLAEYNQIKEIKEDSEAKKYCQFIHHHFPVYKREAEHINQIGKILTNWQGCSKQASWLLIQSISDLNIYSETKNQAYAVLFEVLESDEALPYTKYRLLHHLVNLRVDLKNINKTKYRLIQRLTQQQKKQLENHLKQFLEVPAFEVNIISLYALRLLGKSDIELKQYINDYTSKPLAEPILNALYYLEELSQSRDLNNPPVYQEELDEAFEEAEEFY